MTEPVLRILLSQGILGAMTALFIGLYLKERLQRDKQLEDRAEELKKLNARHASELKELHTAHAAEVKRLNDVHATALKALYDDKDVLRQEHAEASQDLLEQINDLREAHVQRERACLQTVEYFAKQGVEAVEDLALIADLLRRTYETRSRR